jgi:hypothetical protein
VGRNTIYRKLQKMKVKGNKAIVIVDRILRERKLIPKYDKLEIGIILSIKNVNNYSGILFFVNGEEPSNGELPLDQIQIVKEDKISLCFVEQGVYKGDFNKNKGNSVGLHPIFVDLRVKEINEKEVNFLLE